MRKDPNTLIQTVSITKARLQEIIRLHGFSAELWAALKAEMRAKGFAYPGSMPPNSTKLAPTHFTTAFRQGALVHKLWKTPDTNPNMGRRPTVNVV